MVICNLLHLAIWAHDFIPKEPHKLQFWLSQPDDEIRQRTSLDLGCTQGSQTQGISFDLRSYSLMEKLHTYSQN